MVVPIVARFVRTSLIDCRAAAQCLIDALHRIGKRFGGTCRPGHRAAGCLHPPTLAIAWPDRQSIAFVLFCAINQLPLLVRPAPWPAPALACGVKLLLAASHGSRRARLPSCRSAGAS